MIRPAAAAQVVRRGVWSGEAVGGPRFEPHLVEVVVFDPLFVAAHPWDLRAAAEHGFRTAYVSRPAAERPGGRGWLRSRHDAVVLQDGDGGATDLV
jgi:hypothetical protein